MEVAAVGDRGDSNAAIGVVEEVIADPEKPAPIVSVTDLSSFLYCQRSLYQRKVLGYEEKLNQHMVLGAIRHNFYDMANKHEERIVLRLPATASKEEITAAYSETYQNLMKVAVKDHGRALALFSLEPEAVIQELLPIGISEAAERAENVYSFSAQHNVFGEGLWQLLTPKILTEVAVRSQQLRLKGVVDRIEVYENSVLPIELKTGKMAQDGVWPSHRVQVAAYMMLLQEKFRKPAGKAVIRYLDHNSSKTIMLNPYMELEVKELTENVIQLLQSKLIPKPCGRESCRCNG